MTQLSKQEARGLNKVALDVLDLAHCFHTGQANEISFQVWQDQFAREKGFEAARKQWQRWKAELEKHDLCEQVGDGRELHVILKPHAAEAAEALRAEARAVLEAENAERHFPDSVTHKGTVYRLKVYGRELRPLSDQEFSKLKASIRGKGQVQVPVLVDRQNCVVDGKHRLIIATELGLGDVPIQVLREANPKALRALAVELNSCRRHLTKQERAQLRQKLQAEAEAQRAQQKSLRQIAEEQGVDKRTVARALEGVAVDPDQKVCGKDGRLRPAKKAGAEARDERRRRVAELLEEDGGLTVREIAEALGISQGTAQRDREEVLNGTGSVVVDEGDVAESSALGINPANDPIDDCLEAALAGLGQIRDRADSETAALVDAVSELVEAVLWRLFEEVPS